MKPRFEPVSYEVKQMLEKAEEINNRLGLLEKSKCDCGKEPCECKDCPKCGSKMNKMGCMKMGCGKMAKAAIEDPKPLPKEKITDVNPHMVTESGGKPRPLTTPQTVIPLNTKTVNQSEKSMTKKLT